MQKSIIINDTFLLFEEDNGKENKILWESIIKVMIETNDLGPFENDLNLILVTINEEIIIPQELDGSEDLFKFLQAFLSDFDNNAVIQAMRSVDNRLFDIWPKQ